MVNFPKKYSQKTSHSSPVRSRYVVSFVDPASDWYSAWVHGIIYAISYYIGPRYNGSGLYMYYMCRESCPRNTQNMVDFCKLFISSLISSVSNQIFCTCVMYDSVPKIDGRPWCLEIWLDLLNLPWFNWNYNRLNHFLGKWIKIMCCACVVDKCCSCVVWWMYDKANVQSKFKLRLIIHSFVFL